MIRSPALCLVTGSTGLVGNNVVRMLLARGDRVRVLQRSGADPRPLAGLDVQLAPGDVRDAAAVAEACRGCDLVVHAAAHVRIGWTGLDEHRAINVAGTSHVVAGALQAGAVLVHVSSVDALGKGDKHKPANEDSRQLQSMRIPYPLTKREAEDVVLAGVAQGLRGVIVNPVFMLGPWDWKPSSGRMLLEVAAGKGLFAPRGSNDFCDVRDVANGILRAAERGVPGRRYILGGEPLSYLAFWRLIAEVTGGPRTICRAGPLAILTAGWIGDLWGRCTRTEPTVNSAAVSLASQAHHYDDSRARTELGYHSRPAREAIVAAWEWFLEHGYAQARHSSRRRSFAPKLAAEPRVL